jgi:hypothetical protein
MHIKNAGEQVDAYIHRSGVNNTGYMETAREPIRVHTR